MRPEAVRFEFGGGARFILGPRVIAGLLAAETMKRAVAYLEPYMEKADSSLTNSGCVSASSDGHAGASSCIERFHIMCITAAAITD